MEMICAEPLCVVMELATNGPLQSLLRQQRKAHSDDVDDDVDMTSQARRFKLTSSDLILFAVHVASGMEYIASQRVRYCRVFAFCSVKTISDNKECI